MANRVLYIRLVFLTLIGAGLLSYQNCGKRFEVNPNAVSLNSVSGGGKFFDGDIEITVKNALADQGGPLVFRVELNHPSNSKISVWLSTESGTAVSGTDFAPFHGLIDIPAGQSFANLTVQNMVTTSTSDLNMTLKVVWAELGTIKNDSAIGTIKARP